MSEKFWGSLESEIITNNTIRNELYDQLEVKRGLRNADGSGVLAGLSQISSVIGTQKTDNGLEPVEGKLKYRGIEINDLIKQISSDKYDCFERTIFLLLVGRLPNDAEYEQLKADIESQNTVPADLVESLIKAIPSANIMNKLQTVVSGLYTLDDDAESNDPVANAQKAVSIIAKLPMIVAYGYLAKYQESAKLVPAPTGKTVAESFLTMLRQGEAPNDLEKDILDLCLCLHAEHGGGNNSTFTTYVVTSSGSDVYCTLAAAIASLKGPLHGAANKMVMDMMADLKANVSDWSDMNELRDYLAKIVRKEVGDKSGKIYGLGHAVYTMSDPRAGILKEKAQELAESKGRLDEFNLYLAIEEEGPKVFNQVKGSDKVIAPNVDFFSGFVYDCLGIPEEVYTPMFAMARCAGWAAHRIEEILSGKRVIRPGYKYVGGM